MAFGYIKRNRQRIYKAWLRTDRTRTIAQGRVVKVKVFVARGIGLGAGGMGYWARACMSRGSKGPRMHSCAREAFGRTPTRAVKNALGNLSRNRDIR
jgi:hypothetical protein